MAGVNEALRAHVTSAKFVLTLGASHIAALARIVADLADNRSTEEMIRDHRAHTRPLRDVDPPVGHPLRSAFRAPGMGGLITRGLVTHTMPYPRKGRTDTTDWRPSDIWHITEAGHAVITLLREAGIWQEYAGALAPAVAVATKARPRRVA
jgi:hypothetical protein